MPIFPNGNYSKEPPVSTMSVVPTLEQLRAIWKNAMRCLWELKEEKQKQEKAAQKAA